MAGIERRGQQLGSIRVVAAPVDADLSTLLKADLVKRADAAGIDSAGLTKAEIIKALQGATDGDVNQDS